MNRHEKINYTENRTFEGIAIPGPYNMADKVGYTIGTLSTGRNAYNAMRYMAYPGTDNAQAIYARYGFVPASDAELKLKPIPLPSE